MNTTIEAGDYVKGYHAGIWKVIKVFDYDSRGTNVPQVEYQKILDSNLKPVRTMIIKSCALGWCNKVTKDSLAAELEEVVERYSVAATWLWG